MAKEVYTARDYSTVSVSRVTKKALDLIARKESYDDIITRLLREAKYTKEIEEAKKTR